MTTKNAVLDTPPKDEKKTEPRTVPHYVVILENDEAHTFPYVIILIQKVFGYSLENAKRLTEEVDSKGEAMVWVGSKEVAELKHSQVTSFGPDLYAAKKVTFPLGCRIEPA